MINRYTFLLLLAFAFLISSYSFAQSYGNEWIKYDQQYLKISTASDGLYKITYQNLVNAGFPVASLNPQNLQLFHRGEEQAILVEGEGDQVFNEGDAIIFFGKQNDGTLDVELYKSPTAQPHSYYNMYSDTTVFFLTFNLEGQAGKRIQAFSENNVNGLTAEPYYFEERMQLFTNEYSGGMAYKYGNSFDTYLTYGDNGEGYTGSVIANGQVRDFTFTGLSNQYTDGPRPSVEMVIVGRNNIYRDADVQVGTSTSSLIDIHKASFTGATHYKVSEQIEWNALSSGQSVVRIKTYSGGRVSASYVKLTYASSWNMNNQAAKVFALPAGASDKRYVEIVNVPEGLVLYDITDKKNIIRIGYNRSGTTISAIVPNGTTARKLLLTNQIQNAPSVKQVSFRNINPANHNYLIVSNKLLYTSAGNYADPVKAYAEYRASVAGGAYDTLLVDVTQLYNQFSYGEISPVAIRRFVRYMAENGDVKYLFLIGKAIDVYNQYYRRATWTSINRDLVPTFGWPGSDMPYTVNIKGSGHAPYIPVGRLGARTADEVANYLNKVKEMEAVKIDALWHKNLIHISGGSNAVEALQFKQYLDGFKRKSEGVYTGAKVKTVSKTEDVVVQEINISKEVNSGLALITFFGHSGRLSSDVEIGYASDDRAGYRNKAKYPCVLMNGCDAGNIFSTAPKVNFSEDWIYTPDRGALNVIAHSAIGYTSLLALYSSHFYEVGFVDTLFAAASVGTIQKEAVVRLLKYAGTGETAISQGHQMVLQGDPAVVLFNATKPDYETNSENVYLKSFDGKPVTMQTDSFQIAVITKNFGRVKTDSLEIKLEYSINGGAAELTKKMPFLPVFYQDTLFLTVRKEELTDAGLSRFTVTLNPDAAIEESNYNNNSAVLEVVIPKGGTVNLLPQNYALINTNKVTLYGQGIDLFSEEREYVIELDTSALFNSAAYKQTVVKSKVLFNWEVDLPEVNAAPEDTIVYFWRSKLLNPTSEEDKEWISSSFTYIKDSPEGWSQSHDVQIREDKLYGVGYEGNQLYFEPILRNLDITTFGGSAPGATSADVSVIIDGNQYIISSDTRKQCRVNSMNVIDFDKASLDPIVSKQVGLLNPRSCGTNPQFINSFSGSEINDNGSLHTLERYLREMPAGNWLTLFSIGSNNYSTWSTGLKDQLFSNFGLSKLIFDQLVDGEPFLLVAQKRAGGEAYVIMGDRSEGAPPVTEQTVNLIYQIKGRHRQGTITSNFIGPAKSWVQSKLKLKVENDDTYKLQVVGLNTTRQEVILKEVIDDQSTIDLSGIDTKVYPYLKLVLQVKDTINLTAPQLNCWQVLYESLPEGVLLVQDSLKGKYIVQEGRTLTPGFKFKNISKKSFTDSLEVETSVMNLQSRKTEKKSVKVKAPEPNETVDFAIGINSEGKVGENNFKLFVNPGKQPEVSLQNNLINLENFVKVKGDTIQPVIDVAFDGVYINNGAIVSPNPLISVIIRDPNTYRLKTDTVGVEIYIKKDCEGCDFQRINLRSAEVQYYEATANDPFKVEYKPSSPLEDGIYTLQVQATDASGNKSGTKPYMVNFEVINKSTVTNFYPYPNPFSTSTRFVFTLTGSEIPQDIKIQIMTVSGKIVKEISKEELGVIRIGTNITDYSWNGKDEWGDQLANGVYLYRVLIRSTSQVFEHRETAGDKAFKQQFGKLYLLR